MSTDDISQYFNLVKKLYSEIIFNQTSQVNNKYLTNHSTEIWTELYKFCIDKSLVMEFANEKGIVFVPRIPFNVEHFAFCYYSENCSYLSYQKTYEDFRLTLENELAELPPYWYFSLRYNTYVSRDIGKESFYGNLTRYERSLNEMVLLSEYEVEALLAKIKSDISRLGDLIEKHKNTAPQDRDTRRKIGRKDFLTWYDECQKWISTDMAYDEEYQMLAECEEIVSNIIEEGSHKGVESSYFDDTLYVYKGKIKCLRDNHPIEQATAVLQDKHGKDIKLNVSHCLNCGKFFIDYDVYQRYRKNYGAILGNVRLASNGEFSEFGMNLAEESPLKLCGYSVSQKDGLSQWERQNVLEGCIESGAMTKSEVINLLKWFIEMNGAKKNNELAQKKWCEDLDFVLALNTDKQNHFRIGKIVKYNRNRFIIKNN